MEATHRSGSLITARLAAEAGRDVWAVPGPLHAPQSEGCHRLIKQGAGLMDDPREILQAATGALGAAHVALCQRYASWLSTAEPKQPQKVAWAVSALPPPLRAALQAGPCTMDTLVEEGGVPSEALPGLLLGAELAGLVARLPGNRFQWQGNPP